MFRDVECRERLNLEPSVPNIRYAVRLRGEIINAIERGKFNYADFFPESDNARRFGFVASGETVGTKLRHWFKEARLAPSTRLTYTRVLERYLYPWFDNVRLRDLTSPMIRSRALEVKSDDDPPVPVTLKTARNILTPLGAMLEKTFGDGEIDSNPMARVKLERYWPEERMNSEWEADPFTFEEMTAIFASCSPEEADYWRFAFGSGLRPSEQIALEWPRCDLIGFRVRIDVARVTGLALAATKSSSELKGPKTRAGKRDVDLTAGAWDALQRQMARTRLADAHVFLDPLTGGPWRTEEILRKRWKWILKRAGVRYRNPYQTRHTFASVLLAGGWSELAVMRWMGHATVDMLRRNYGKWIDQGSNPETRAAVAAFFSHASPAVRKAVEL